MAEPGLMERLGVDVRAGKGTRVPCCPELDPDKSCNTLTFNYRLLYPVGVQNRRVVVEVIIEAELRRCPGPLTLGDLVYTTTLLPGEKVRLFSTDRRSRFTFDSESQVSYRHEQTSEESYFMKTMADFMSDLTVRDSGRSTATSSGSTSTEAETGGIFSFLTGPSVEVSGEYNSESTLDFFRELTRHAEGSQHRAVEGARFVNSVAVGEVNRRTHAEGESEDHFEASSRTFHNPNRCHAVTYLFHQINKTQTVYFRIVAVRRRVVDPAADNKVANRPFTSPGAVGVIPQAVLATSDKRIDAERIGRRSVALQGSEAVTLTDARPTLGANVPYTMAYLTNPATRTTAPPLEADVRAEALDSVDKQLVAAGVLAHPGSDEVAEKLRAELTLEMTSSLPTAGLLVRGCLDECSVCEPALKAQIKLELLRKELENRLLERKIELLEKSQEYRCCPANEEEVDDD